MLNQEQVQALIVCRLLATEGTCNSFHIGHVEGQLRALAAVLNDGQPAAPQCGHDLAEYLAEVGIPYTLDDKQNILWDEQWMQDHCFTAEPNPIKRDDVPPLVWKHPFMKRGW